MELGYARVSTSKQDLARQIDALTKAGIEQAHIYVDKKSGATTERPGLQALLGYARGGDVIVVHTLDRLGRTVRDTLNLIHDLHQRGIGFRNLADPVRIDSTNPDDPMGQLAVVLLALFGQMERTYAVERAAHARTVAAEKGRRVGRPSVVTDAQLAYAIQLRDGGATIAEITAKTGLTRSTLYRHLPSRPPERLTAETALAEEKPSPSTAPAATLPAAGSSACPTCGYEPSARRDLVPHRADLATVWLHLDDRGRVREARHCARCQPHSHVLVISCSRCGDGPLVTGTGTGTGPGTGELPVPVRDWFKRHGWVMTPDPLCPNHI
ncbi:recombinase family protein (plasmid) [Rhodococcus pseudokoreensis]|uniref:Recombinase family protein n=1 Tax=Rhodococcus pseudokoreensis TaxID=2811421 RepID=A0A974VZW8_9NOCA|nr:recombinase family protein [Rhodococcus pseudokoreensis]QSE87873.1 recombinase family protein [Rhodococcus pseudokoreensis]